MVKAFIISGICFTIGNVIWDKFDDPRIFYVPLAVFLLIGTLYVRKTVKENNKLTIYFLDYLWILASGNVIKQVFYYNDAVSQINDYWWGGFVTLWLIFMIIKWAIQSKHSGRK